MNIKKNVEYFMNIETGTVFTRENDEDKDKVYMKIDGYMIEAYNSVCLNNGRLESVGDYALVNIQENATLNY